MAPLYNKSLFIKNILIAHNRIGGVMERAVVSSVVDRGFYPRSGQTKD
jgi:hypothetical protein